MAGDIRRIGVLTGGGDCPGLNAVIRAVTKSAIFRYHLEVFGIEDGFQGLVHNRLHPLTASDVSNILTLGGTILGTNNRCDPKRYPVKVDGEIEFRDVSDRVLEHIEHRHLDALIVIGGDGTMAVASHFCQPRDQLYRGAQDDRQRPCRERRVVSAFPPHGTSRRWRWTGSTRPRPATTGRCLWRSWAATPGWIALHAGVASGCRYHPAAGDTRLTFDQGVP